MNTRPWGKEFPSKHTTLVPLLPKQERKEHHSIFPPSVPNKTAVSQTLTGKGMDIIPRTLHAGAQPSARPPSAKTGDVGAATRGRDDAVAGAPGVVVINLGT